ncbi:MAG: ornithine carbamoyltransferase [Candidatus Ranarchaeia archaeon]
MTETETSLRGRDFLSLADFTPSEINDLILKTMDLKMSAKKSASYQPLARKYMAMVFAKSSTRTRISFEVGMHQLGGHALFLNQNDLQLGRGETINDTGKVVSRYVDVIMARLFNHQDILDLSKAASVPVINGLTDLLHPCQILADLVTIREKKGPLKGLTLSYVGDGNNVCHSLLFGCAKVGIHLNVATPKGYEPSKKIVKKAKEIAGKSGSRITLFDNAKQAVTGVDVIYTDTFVSMGKEGEKQTRLEALMPFQVNPNLVKSAKPDFLFMHCLPAHRGEEVTDQIMDDPEHSIIWDQAENRLHAQKAILIALLG